MDQIPFRLIQKWDSGESKHTRQCEMAILHTRLFWSDTGQESGHVLVSELNPRHDAAHQTSMSRRAIVHRRLVVTTVLRTLKQVLHPIKNQFHAQARRDDVQTQKESSEGSHEVYEVLSWRKTRQMPHGEQADFESSH